MTVGDVLKAFECCSGYDPKCEDCPYRGIGMCESVIKEDAVLYLKEYKDYLDFQKEENEPLTWQELIKMEFKPVWVKVDGYVGHWSVVRMITPHLFGTYYAWLKSPDDPMKAPIAELNEENYGKTWKAYRKERK